MPMLQAANAVRIANQQPGAGLIAIMTGGDAAKAAVEVGDAAAGRTGKGAVGALIPRFDEEVQDILEWTPVR